MQLQLENSKFAGKIAFPLGRRLLSWHSGSCEKKSSTINTPNFTSPWPRMCNQAVSKTIFWGYGGLIWSGTQWQLQDLFPLPVLLGGYQATAAPPLASSLSSVSSHSSMKVIPPLNAPTSTPPPVSSSTHLWQAVRKHGSSDAAAEAELQSFEIRPAGGKALLRHPECVMHYLINTNAAVWPLQDDWLVLSRPLKQTLSRIVRVKTFKRASRLQNPKRFLPLAEPSACVAS